ncbi:MAG: phage tail assembly chaperone [Pseudomonadota bacterium]
MAKLTLTAAAVFKAVVEVPLHGGATGDIEFQFKHRKRDDLDKFIKAAAVPGRDEVETMLEMASGWDLEDPFNRESIETLLQNYIAAGGVVFNRYIEEHTKVREKN